MTSTPVAVHAELVESFLAAIEAGDGAALRHLYAADARLDATVPNWRFALDGSEAIGAEYARWFGHPGRVEELDVQTCDAGVVLRYFLTWVEGGVPHGAHHCHALTIEDGLVSRDTVFCGGRWDAALMARMEDAARGG